MLPLRVVFGGDRMSNLYVALFGWMPAGLATICIGVVTIFFIVTVLHIIRFVMDIIPFV